MLNQKIKTAYSKELANTYDMERFSTRSGEKIHEIETENLNAAIHLVSKDSKILEVGCGTGRLLVEVNESGYKADGVDASTDMLTECNKKMEGRFQDTKLTVGEAAQIPCPDSSYDFVYSIRLLNQTSSSEYALNVVGDMVRVTKPGGYILVEFVNYYRPGLFRRSKRKGVFLKPTEVSEYTNRIGAVQVWCRGAFFLGMTALHVVPDFMVGFVSMVDGIFSKLFPKLCGRCYILLRKKAQ